MEPKSPYEKKDSKILSRYLRRIGYEIKPDEGDKASNSYKEYWHKSTDKQKEKNDNT